MKWHRPPSPARPSGPWPRGARSRAVTYDDAAAYYAGQVVTYLGGTYIRRSTVPQGTAEPRQAMDAPIRDADRFESAKVHTPAT